MNNKKAIIISTIIVLLLVIGVGVAYAFFTYENGTRSEIVTGQIYMNYEETNTLFLDNVWPESKTSALARNDENATFEFTITGQNTSKYPIYYEVDLLSGGVVTGKTEASTRILPEHVMIYLEKDGEPVVDGVTYADWNSRRIYVETIPAGTASITHNYVLRMWIDENVTISDTDLNADYSTEEWNGSYTSLQVRVVGDFEEKTMPTAADEIIATLGRNGLVAINEDGELIGEVEIQTSSSKSYKVTPLATYNGQIVREYRYSGGNDVVNKNYVWFNDELWRIIGVFPTENENGITENLVKIIKATPLTAEEIPTIYTYNGVEMTLKHSDDRNTVYWNYSNYFGQTNKNDWTQAALQYFLNDETSTNASYYNSIAPTYQGMIQETTYYLGNVITHSDAVDRPMNVYIHERSLEVASNENIIDNLWEGNVLEWSGKIGLMYPSDYGYAADSTYWQYRVRDYSLDSIRNNNWLYDNSNSRWTISPSVYCSFYATFVSNNGYVANYDVDNDYSGSVLSPVLYLKSDVMFSGGTGADSDPYTLEYVIG